MLHVLIKKSGYARIETTRATNSQFIGGKYIVITVMAHRCKMYGMLSYFNYILFTVKEISQLVIIIKPLFKYDAQMQPCESLTKTYKTFKHVRTDNVREIKIITVICFCTVSILSHVDVPKIKEIII